MRRPITIWKDAYEIRIKNRRIIVKKLEDSSWNIEFVVLHHKEVNIAQYDNVISHGDYHICRTLLRVTEETMQHLISGYYHFQKAHFPNQTPIL